MAYADDVAVSESARQAAKAANNTAVGHLVADQQHYLNLVTAGRKWGVKNHAMQALLNLGGAVPAGSFKDGDL